VGIGNITCPEIACGARLAASLDGSDILAFLCDGNIPLTKVTPRELLQSGNPVNFQESRYRHILIGIIIPQSSPPMYQQAFHHLFTRLDAPGSPKNVLKNSLSDQTKASRSWTPKIRITIPPKRPPNSLVLAQTP
jgi:hypothetical protein